jgi:anti-sigma B factor antagonist
MTAVLIDEGDKSMSDRSQAADGATQLRVAGPLTAATAPELRTRLRDAVDQGHARVVVDLQAVTGLDAAGIAALLDAHRTIQAQTGGTLVLRTNAIVCRALRESGTIAAFALLNGSGM